MTTSTARGRYLDEGLWTPETLTGRLRYLAQDRPDATAVIDHEAQAHTFAELYDDAGALAAFLAAEAGVEPGDVVSIQLPNWYEFVAAAMGAYRLGAIVNPLLPGYRGNELRYILDVAATRAIFTPAEYRGFEYAPMIASLRSALDDLTTHVVVGGDGSTGTAFNDALDRYRGQDVDESDRAAEEVSEIIFTSGTEARPKAIMHTEQTANFSVRQAYDDLSMTSDDVVWMPSPLGHSTGFNYGMRFAIFHGLPLVLQDRWEGEQAAQIVARHGCSYTLAATTFLTDLLAAARNTETRLSSLTRFGCGGAPVPAHVVDEAEAAGIEVLRLYGSTEGLVITWNRPDSPPGKRRHTDGYPIGHVEIEVRDSDDSLVPPGEEGEIFVRGPNTCVGFFGDEERTAATFGPNGWVRSGDVGVVDGDGYLSIVGRRKEIIIRGGMNIAPREIEDLLLELPAVRAVAVVGLPDERLGEIACACVVPAEGAVVELEQLVTHLSEADVARYKFPQRLELVDELPMTASGKVKKHQVLRTILERES